MSSFPPHLLILFLLSLSLSSSSSSSSSPLSTIAISHVQNQTLICALLPSTPSLPSPLTCKAFPSANSRSYRPAPGFLFSALAAGNGFLCALSSSRPNPSLSTMRWWDFSQSPSPSKRVYKGPSLTSLSSADSHVCALISDSGHPHCWRWPHLTIPHNFTAISVGRDFLCGVDFASKVLCFGSNASGVVGNEPKKGIFTSVSAGTRHACAVFAGGRVLCWGAGAPAGAVAGRVSSLALGDGRTCAVRLNGTLLCLGPGAEPPSGFQTAQFMAVEARGSVFCGVLTENYSVVCWGNEAFLQNPVVFSQVLPGTCRSVSTCRCGVLPGSGNACALGDAICQSCPVSSPTAPPPPPSPPPPPRHPSSSSISSSHPSNRRQLLFILLGTVGFGIGSLASACFLIIRAKNQSGRVHDSGRVPSADQNAAYPTINLNAFTKGPTPVVEEYTIESLLAATDGFAEKHKIGSGGFGSVYRATLPNGRVVAVKRAKAARNPSASTSRSAPLRRREMETAFLAELALLSRVNHKNLVRLYGFCREGAELILVYEFMTRGTLDARLREPAGSPLGSWAGRIRIALDAARGIEYLHAYAVPTIIHRDIKPSNILLDDDWTAKVSDFGLSLLNPIEGEEENGGVAATTAPAAAGTVGYMDPEYYRLRHLTAKSDVYSFGVMLLELLTGCRAVERSADSGTPRNVVEHAVPRIEVDEVHCVLDGRLPTPTPCEIEAVAYVGYLAADCVSPTGIDRPSMTEVVAGLERALLACEGACGATNQTGSVPTGLSRFSSDDRSG